MDGEQNGVLTLPSIPEEDRYQDSGEYVCTAGNGIVGRDGNVRQTGYGYVNISAQPIFTNDNSLTQYGEFGKNIDIHVYVYSIPKYKTKTWYRGNKPISPSTKYSMSDPPTIVNDTFHGKYAQLDGYSVMLTIKNLKESDINVSYRLQLSYGTSQTVQTTVLLESAKPQELSGLVGGVIGGVVAVLIILMIILGIIFLRRKKGLSDGRDKTKSNRNEVTAAYNPTNNDTYEDIEGATNNQRKKDPWNKRVETPSIKIYEVLGMKDIPNTFADLSSGKEQMQSLPSTEHYEALGQQDRPYVYDCIKNKEESEDKEYVNLQF